MITNINDIDNLVADWLTARNGETGSGFTLRWRLWWGDTLAPGDFCVNECLSDLDDYSGGRDSHPYVRRVTLTIAGAPLSAKPLSGQGFLVNRFVHTFAPALGYEPVYSLRPVTISTMVNSYSGYELTLGSYRVGAL